MLYVNPLESQYTRGLNVHTGPGREKLAYQELEHSFLYMLMDEMSKTTSDNPLFGAGPEADYQRQMMNDAWAGAMAESGQLGIAKQMEQQAMLAELSRPQAVFAAARQAAKVAMMQLPDRRV